MKPNCRHCYNNQKCSPVGEKGKKNSWSSPVLQEETPVVFSHHKEALGTLIIVGNPNVGKTTIFRKLCKKNVHFENHGGTSVELAHGRLNLNGGYYDVVDLPGITSLFANSEEEFIAREVILKEKNKVLLHIADAKSLQRALTLNAELIELGIPMILVLNMMDEALQKGLIIDDKTLKDILGIDVVMTIGNEGEGINELKKCLIYPKVSERIISYPEYIENGIIQIQNVPHKNGYLNRAFVLQLLVKHSGIMNYIKETFFSKKDLAQVDQIIEQVNSRFNGELELTIAQRRVHNAIDIETDTIKYLPVKKKSFVEKFSNWSCHPIYGIPILLSVMVLLYLFVGRFGAEMIADFIQFTIFEGYIIPFAVILLNYIPSQFVFDAFLGTYGLISVGLTASIGIVLPIICTFFFAFSLLEESGYLSRVAILLNSVFNKIGLNGKAVLPLFLGFSCVTMATFGVKALNTKKERIITILLLWLCIPCSAQLSIFAAILASISLKAVLVIIGVVVFQMLFVGFLAGKFIPGEKSSLFMEIHPVRLPNIKYTFIKTASRVYYFLKEVIPLFLAGSFFLFLLDRIRVLHYIELAGKPIVTELLGLPPRITEVFMLGFIRREAGAAFFKTVADAEHLSEIQIIVAMVVMTLFIPCIASVLVVVKEYGTKIAMSLSAFVMGYALLIGIILNRILNMVY